MTEIGRFITEPRNYDDSLILQNECSMCFLAKCSLSLSSGIMAERYDFFYCCIILLILTLFFTGYCWICNRPCSNGTMSCFKIFTYIYIFEFTSFLLIRNQYTVCCLWRWPFSFCVCLIRGIELSQRSSLQITFILLLTRHVLCTKNVFVYLTLSFICKIKFSLIVSKNVASSSRSTVYLLDQKCLLWFYQ